MSQRIFTPLQLLLFFFLSIVAIESSAQSVITMSEEAGSNSTSPLVGGDTDKIIFGILLNKDANSLNLTDLTILLDKNPNGIILNARLMRSTDATLDGGDTQVAVGTLGTSPNRIDFSGSLSNMGNGSSNVDRWFFLKVDIDPTTTTTTLQPSITKTQISFDVTPTSITPSTTITGSTNYTINALTTSITQQGGISTGIAGGATNRVLMAFKASTNGTQSLGSAVFTLTIDPTTTTLLKNYKLIDNGTSSTYTGGGTPVGVLTANGPAKTLTFNTIGVALSSTDEYFFLIADADPSVSSANGNVTTTFTSATPDQGTISGTGFAAGPIPFQDLTATLNSIVSGAPITATPLEAGTQNAVLAGFSIVSTGGQTISQVDFGITGAAGTLSNFELFKSTTPGVVGSSVATSTTGSFTALTQVISGTTIYYYLVADVSGSLTTATTSASVTLDETNITLNAGTKGSLAINRSLPFTQSQSTVVVSNSGQGSIDIAEYTAPFTQSVLTSVNSTNSQTIFAIDITDGDTDSHPTTITQLDFTVTNFSNLATISLFDGTTKVGSSQAVTTGSISFTGLNYIINDGTIGSPNTKTLSVKVTFNAHVTDNDLISVQLTGATVLTTGSSLASFSGIQTGPGKNPVNVVATELVFVDPAGPTPPSAAFVGPVNTPPSPQIGSTFQAIVWAVDASFNLDADENSSISLTVTNGPSGGSLSGDGSPQSLSGGIKQFNSLTVNKVGSYELNAISSSLTDAKASNGTNIDLIAESIGTSITKADLSACKVGSGNFFTLLPNLVLTENDNGDFVAGTNLTFLLILPAGWEFLTPSTTTPTPTYSAPNISCTSSRNITSPVFANFIGTNIAKFTYSVTGTDKTDVLTISGLYVKNVSGIATATLFRSGTGVIKGADDTKSLGTLTTSAGSTTVSFGVQEIPGNPAVSPSQTSFNISSSAVKLVGSPVGGSFSGSSVISTASNGDTFSPQTIGVGTYPITYTYTEPTSQHCQIDATKNFTVIANYINGLLNTYCTSAPPSTISIPQATVDAHNIASPAGTYHFNGFVYYDYPNSFTFIPSPSNTVFDPSDPAYANSITLLGGVYIGYSYMDNSNVVQPINVFSVHYIFIQVTKAPVLTFNLPSTACVNASPIDLDNVVIPTPQVPATDNFTALTSVSSPSTNQWLFTPSTVPGANTSQQSVSITYNYKDPGTSCTSSITKSITINPTPAQIPSVAISPATTIELCQGGIVGSFTAQTIAGVTYNWYSDNSLSPAKLIRQGDLLSPSINNTVATTTDYFVTQTVNSCESTLPRQVSVIVNPTPAAPGSDFSRSYCLNSTVPANDFTITGSSVKWYSSTDNFATPVFLGNNPTASNLGVSTTLANAYSFQTTQTSNKSCESSPIKVIVTVKDLPVLTITSSVTDLTKICRTTADINFKANQPNGIWSGTASSALFNTIPGLGSTQLNSLNLVPGTFTLKYDYTDLATTCSNFATTSLTILPTIVPSLSVGDACDGFFVNLTNTSTISPSNSTSVIDSIGWDFGDQSSLPLRPYNNLVPSGFSTITKGKFKSPSHIFKSVGTFVVSYTMRTSDGCKVTGTKQVINNEVPRAAFTWFNSCFDNTTNTVGVQFAGTNLNDNLNASEIQDYTWNFATTSVLTFSAPGSGKNPLTTYSKIGRDSVQLIVTTINNCKDTIQKPIFIVPSYPPITENNSYYEDFNTASGGWISGGTNSSWQYGKPVAPIINRDSSITGKGNAWVTNLTGNNNANEQSWVLSQCYDFSQASKPVLSMDIWSDTPRPIDGAVLQYNESNSIENNTNWKVLGQINLGVNWYDINGIASKPGNQLTGDVGWSGDKSLAKYKKGWVHVVYKLDELIGKPNVKFRIAFASNFGRQEGFAFDNIFIGERSRSVLIENFTNTSLAANAVSQNNFFNLYGGATANEIVKLQFHTDFPGYDTLNALNKPMNNARTAFYGITNSPSIRIDGQVGTGTLASWFDDLYDERVLSPSPLKIIINPPTKVGDVVSITASIKNITSSALNLKNANVFIVVAEKKITSMPWLGQAGNTELTYVAKTMLPTVSGIPIAKILAPGETFDVPQTLWSQRDLINSGNGILLVYVQSLMADREVYQAKIYDNPVQPDITTGIEPILAEQIKFYPNPADQSLVIELPQAVTEFTPVKVFDVNGHEVKGGAFEKGQQIKKLNTEDFSGGVYLIQMNTGNTVIRKKIVIVH